MGRRGRVVLRLIEDRARRRICFRRRLAEMEKKAKELAVHCDAHVGFVALSRSDGGVHHFAAPTTIENIVERYKNTLAAQGVRGRGILEKNKRKDFQVTKETTDKGANNDDMRSIDETDMSTLNMDLLSQIERSLEDELRWTRARKLEADRVATLQKKQQHPSKKEIKVSNKQDTLPDVQMEAWTTEYATHALQVQGKKAIVESSFMEMPSGQEKEQAAGGSQQSAEVELVSLSIGSSGVEEP